MRCIDCEYLKPFPKEHENKGLFYCEPCKDEENHKITYKEAIKDEDCDVYVRRFGA